ARQAMQQSAVSSYATQKSTARMVALKEREDLENQRRANRRPRLVFYLDSSPATPFGDLYRPVLHVDFDNHAHLNFVVKNIGELAFENGWINVAAGEQAVLLRSGYAHDYS